MWHNRTSKIVALVSILLLPTVRSSAGIVSGEGSIESEITAVREMVLEALRGKIRSLAKERLFYCRNEHWPWRLSSWEACRASDWVRFGVVKTDEDPPDDALFGAELVDLLRKCTIDDAVPFGAISNRIVRTVGLAWIGNDGSSLGGVVAITPRDVYFIYTNMELFKGPEAYYGVYDVFEDPPYYLWKNPYRTHRVWLTGRNEFRECWKRIDSKTSRMYHDPQSRSDFLFAKVVTAFRLDISPEEFQRGCIRIGAEPIENDLETLRRLVLETIREQTVNFADSCDFYCRDCENMGDCTHPELALHILAEAGFCDRFGTVKPHVDLSEDVLFGMEILDSLRRCTLNDAIPLGSISNRIVKTVGLSWIRRDGSSFSGVAIVTACDVYFIYTVMVHVTEKESGYHNISGREPPYYVWQKPLYSQYMGLSDKKKVRACGKRIDSKSEKMFSDPQVRDEFLFGNSITAFRIDVSQEKFRRHKGKD